MSSNNKIIDDIPKSFAAGADFVCVNLLESSNTSNSVDLQDEENILNKNTILIKKINNSLKNILSITNSEFLEDLYLNSQFIISH
jgi:hypothetical protein